VRRVSLRWRLTLLSGSLALVTTAVIWSMLELRTNEQFFSEIADTLEEECDEVMVVLQDPRLGPFIEDFLRIETSHRFIPQRYYFEVRDLSGNVFARSENLQNTSLPLPTQWTYTEHGQAVNVTTVSSPVAPPGDPVLVRSERVEVDIHGRGREILVIQIGVSVGAWEDRRAQRFVRDGVLGASILAAIFLLLWSAITMSLRPVVAITRKAAQINAHDLDERIPLTGRADELDELARVLNEMLDRLADSMRQTAAFSAHAAHQLRTPLTRIQGQLDLMLREQMPHALRTDAEEVQEEVQRLSHLCSRLLLLGRLELRTREDSVMSEKVDLGAVAEELVDQFTPVAREKGVALELESCPAAWVRGNRILLAEALLNLIDNAIRWTPKGGTVRVAVGSSGQEASVSVSDTGPGISPEHREHIFRPFCRMSESPPANVPKGSGMGLAIARAIARAHAGRIDLAPPAGGGCVFQLSLPVSPPQDVPQQRPLSDKISVPASTV
jgi:signal transduction histidine kinase